VGFPSETRYDIEILNDKVYMFVTKLYYTAGHAGIHALGDIGLCIPIWNANRVNELGTYQVKHGIDATNALCVPNRARQDDEGWGSVSAVRFYPTIKIVGLPLTFYKLSQITAS